MEETLQHSFSLLQNSSHVTLLHMFTICLIVVQIMLVIGGQAPKAIRSVELYDFKSEKWSHAADMPSRRCRSGLTSFFRVVNMSV